MNLGHTVHLHDVPAQPWRNGGGVTHELLAWPSAAAWAVRVSVATIDRSGPFSPFPGVSRWFTVLSGEGVQLQLPRGTRTLVPGDEPLHFDGEAAPDCQLVEGPTRDLNFMSMREAGSARMASALPGSTQDGGARWRGLYAADAVMIDCDGVTEPVAAGTLLWTDDAAAPGWTLHHARSGRAWWLTLEAR
jgi:uncharacterized protein